MLLLKELSCDDINIKVPFIYFLIALFIIMPNNFLSSICRTKTIMTYDTIKAKTEAISCINMPNDPVICIITKVNKEQTIDVAINGSISRICLTNP